jgi:2-desacetyl-2-hydroxyethyl bacteriochlorophyllide A dehydrogenase
VTRGGFPGAARYDATSTIPAPVTGTRHEGGQLRTALLIAPGRIELRETDEPRPGSGDVVVRVGSVGICGTDLSIHAGKIPVEYPRVMGHEIVGILETPGEPATDVPVGRQVIVDPGIACGACRQCREGRSNICTRGPLLGRDTDGGLRERLAVPASNVHPLPDAIDPSVAPVLQVLATCVHAQRRVSIFPGESVVVIGLGVTGLLHVQLAKLRGAQPVVGVTRSPDKLALAEALGADVLIPADGSEAHGVEAAVPGGADLVIEAAGTVGSFARAMEMARTGGRILAYGTMTETTGELPFYDLYHKELTIVGARSARVEDFPSAIDAVASGRVALGPLLSARFPIAEIDRAIHAGGAPGALKVLVDV